MKKNSDYYVDPDTDIVFLRESPTIDHIKSVCWTS